MLIYLLDLTAVIFVSAILVEEKYLAIDFARKELQGQRYLPPVREALTALVRPAPGAPLDREALGRGADAVRRAELAHGAGLGTADPAAAFAAALEAGRVDRGTAYLAGRALLVRIANQSNLILDPDLDSYYTMSLALLRLPELLEVVAGSSPGDETRERLAGRLEAAAHGIESDFAEAMAAGDARLRERLRPVAKALRASLADARADGDDAALRARLLDDADAAWIALEAELGRLLQARIDRLFARMWLHLGTALALLAAILSVVTLVARQIAVPLRHLSDVADRVRTTGDRQLRARWDSSDEIGRTVAAFNEMLEQLERQRLAQQALAARASAAQAQRELLEAIPIPLVVTAIPRHEVLHANEPAASWLRPELDDPWARGLEPAARARLFQQLSDAGAVHEFEVRWNGDAGPSWAVLSARRLRYQDREAVLVTFTPINVLKQLEQRLALWAKVFEASSEGIVIMSADRRIVGVNRAFSRSTGHEFAEIAGERLESMLAGPEAARLARTVVEALESGDAWQGEVWLKRRGAEPYPAWLMLSAVRDAAAGSRPSHYIGLSVDVTDRRRTEKRIEFLAHHDVLTELPNRTVCVDRLREAIRRPRGPERVAVLFIDLDRFKQVNDVHGHPAGDRLLQVVGTRLRESVRAHDTVCRLGGDEFVVLIDGFERDEEVARLVDERIRPNLVGAVRLDDTVLHVSCSIGVAVWPRDGDDVETLMRHADAAMYSAKAAGRNAVRWFSPELTERVRTRATIESALRGAWERGELALHWQPRIDARDGRIVGAEGLLRWTHPELGEVPPARFVPIAEESGLIRPLGRWVIERACAQQAAWAAEGLGRLPVSINLSSTQLDDEALPLVLQECLRHHGVPARTLELEVTESVIIDDARPALDRLRALGVLLSIDDFGTGYSSLSYLKRFPIDKLKIDRSFVHDMLDDPTDRAIVRAIVGLGHTLGLAVVAEGVETAAQADALREEGCDELQGWLFDRAMPAEALARRLREAAQPKGRTPISAPWSPNANAAQATRPATTAIASREAGPVA